MAKGKRSTGKHYISKGIHRNVSKVLLRDTKRDQPLNIDALLQSMRKKELICARPHGPEEKRLKEKWEREDRINVDVESLSKVYPWIPRQTILFAVQTDYVDKAAPNWEQRKPVVKQEPRRRSKKSVS